MVLFNWEVLSLYAAPSENGLSDVVKRIVWRCQVTEGSYIADVYRDTFLTNAQQEFFVSYDSLTPETVIDWIKSHIDIPALEAELLAKLEEVKNPSIVDKKLPWIYVDQYSRQDKYILVHNGQVVHGPVHWHSSVMNEQLVALGLPASLPEDIIVFRKGIAPIDQPLIINDSTRFYRVNLLNEQPPNNIFYDNGHIDWDLSGGRAIGTYNSVAKDLTEAKETVRMILNNIRSDKELTPISVTVQNRSINVPIEPVFRLNLINRLSSLDDNATCKVQFANNIWLDVTKNELTQIHNEVEIAVQNGYDWQYSRAVLVDQAQTVADLEQILNQE
jgi:hypothetical protein